MTTTTTFLAQNKRCFNKLKDEVYFAFNNNAEIDDKFITQLSYLKAIIEKDLRLFSSIFDLTRNLLKEIVDENYILEDVIVMLETRTIARNQRNYIDLDTFKLKR